MTIQEQRRQLKLEIDRAEDLLQQSFQQIDIKAYMGLDGQSNPLADLGLQAFLGGKNYFNLLDTVLSLFLSEHNWIRKLFKWVRYGNVLARIVK